MKVLVITNKVNEGINHSLFNVFGAVNQLNTMCDVVVVGHQLHGMVNQISNYKIINRVISIDNPTLDVLIVDNIANQIATIIKNYTHVMVAADDFGKNLLPRIAGILECGQISEVTKIISPNIYQKFIYTGNVLVELESLEDIKLLTIRCANFDECQETVETKTDLDLIVYDQNQISNKIKYIKTEYAEVTVDLSHAKVVVTGGRSLLTKDNFNNHIRALANKLNAGIGATRAAVEEGLATNDCQVGQTGKNIAPNVYLAFGVSGAVQHIMGMKNSKCVIAINTDQTAPIFEYADYGMVADLFDVIPELTSKL